ncbi:hypothetical protein HMPREF9134_01432 [Porphyromonas catoniae F0037]|uniref:Uncharacterized protein n=1 Tax=Porphyromonas catoniae F0037 TaxID=1127696 RepID=L1NAZ8_9PORP|nr:hypothetical protein HMPREF9134_01432 [Porphyromonas catoniae F0037]
MVFFAQYVPQDLYKLSEKKANKTTEGFIVLSSHPSLRINEPSI